MASDVDLRGLASHQFRDRAEFQPLRGPQSGLRLQLVDLPGLPAAKILCDISQSQPRPLVPRSWTRKIFNHFHSISHGGGRATLRDIKPRFVWKSMSSDILRWSRECPDCAASKVSRHVHSPLVRRPESNLRFGSIHVDLVGPLPESEGMRYLFTVVDCFTRWPEAIPLATMTARDCANALLRHWIARFGVPGDLTSDQGRQFTGRLWHELGSLLGIRTLRTTAYHPQCNGMVERFHRTLKERLLARNAGHQWMQHLPMVLLGIRSSIREDCGRSPADLVVGSPLRLPGQLLPSPPALDSVPTEEFTKELFSSLRAALPMPDNYHGSDSSKSSPPSSLMSATHVYVRVDSVRPPLTRPYCGPFKVLSATPKTFRLDRGGVPWTVSVDRLKRAPSPLDVQVGAPSTDSLVSTDNDELDSFPADWFLPRAPHGPAANPSPPLDPGPAAAAAESADVSDADISAAEDPLPVNDPVPVSPLRTHSGRISNPPDRWMF